MSKKQKKMLIRIVITAVMVLILQFISVSGLLQLALYLAAYLIIGYDILRKAGKGILNRRVFDENFLMAIATVGAFALAIYSGSGDYNEAIAVMLFYQIGELFQSYAVGKSRRNISALMDIRPDYANIERDGKLEKTDPDEVAVDSIIVVQPGEKVPLDGIVLEGTSSLNTSALTGESLPRDVKAGDEIISGTGGKLQFTEIQIRELYYQICQSLYAGCLLWSPGSCRASAADSAAVSGAGGCLEHVDLPCADFPGYQLSLCTGYQYSAQFFCRYRRSQ